MLSLILLLVLSPYTAILIGVYALFKVYKEKEYYIFSNFDRWNLWNVGLFLLFIWAFIVGILNKSIMSTAASLGLLLYMSLCIIIENSVTSAEVVDKVCRYLVKVSIFAGIFGIIERILLESFPMIMWRVYTGLPINGEADFRISSTFVNSNVAAGWFAVMIIICMYYINRCTNVKEKRFYEAATILFVIDICLAGSRGAFVGLIGGLAVFFYLKGNKRNLIIISMIVLVIAVIGFMPSEVSAISEEITGHKIERSVDQRKEIWEGSARMIEKKPLTGWGLTGTIEQSYRYFRADRIIYHSHNIWLSITTSLGIVGIVIYGVMRLSLYRSLWYLYKSGSRMFPLLAAVQVAILFHGLIDFTIVTPQIGILFMGSSSIIFALARNEAKAMVKEGSLVNNSAQCRI